VLKIIRTNNNPVKTRILVRILEQLFPLLPISPSGLTIFLREDSNFCLIVTYVTGLLLIQSHVDFLSTL